MAELDITDEQKTTFAERCIAMVNRGLGEFVLKTGVRVEVEVGVDPQIIASYNRGEVVIDADGRSTTLWTGLMLGRNNGITKFVESEHDDEHVRPKTASEDVMVAYMLGDIRNLFFEGREKARMILADFLHAQNEAERLGLLDVSADDVSGAIHEMDAAIAQHDTTR